MFRIKAGLSIFCIFLFVGCTLNEPPYTIDEDGKFVYKSRKVDEQLPETMELPGVYNSKNEEIKLLLVNYVAPYYPEDLKANGIEGEVEVQFEITKTGAPKNILILHSLPEGAFDGVVKDIMIRWRFVPQKYNDIYTLFIGFEL